MASLSTTSYDVFVSICDYLPDSDFLRLLGVCRSLRDYILQTNRIENVLSKQYFFVTADALDDLVQFSGCLAFARRLKHLVLDLSSPRFNFDLKRYEKDMYCNKRRQDENLPEALKHYVSRENLSFDDLSYAHRKRRVFPKDNQVLLQRLEKAFKGLPNLSTLEFTHTYRESDSSDCLAPEHMERIIGAWGKFNPILSQVMPDWKTKIKELNLIEYFDPLNAECRKETIYAEVLAAAAKFGYAGKLSRILLDPTLEYRWAGVELARFHGPGIDDPRSLVDMYKATFANLKAICLHLNPTIEGPALSPTFLPMMENIEDLRITFNTDIGDYYPARPYFPFPSEVHLPKLRCLEISLSLVALEDITSFLVRHKDTLMVFRTKYEFTHVQKSRPQLVEFLNQLYNNLSLMEFYMQLGIYSAATVLRPQYGGFPWDSNRLYSIFGIQAYGDWKNDDASPFQFCLHFGPYSDEILRREYLDPSPRVKWHELIQKVKAVEFARRRPPPSRVPLFRS
ncbi:hypothetical protein TWF281_010916 [Arthrobotrys megalospora]